MALLATDILQNDKMPKNYTPFSQLLAGLGLPLSYTPKWCDYDY